jgi:hypothetical protein
VRASDRYHIEGLLITGNREQQMPSRDEKYTTYMKCIRAVIRKECAKENKDLSGAESRPVREAVQSQLTYDVRKDAGPDQ